KSDRIRHARDAEPDATSTLWFGMHALLSGDLVDAEALSGEAVEQALLCRWAGYLWLAEQYEQVAWRLYKKLPDWLRAETAGVAEPAAPSVGPWLLNARIERKPWEITLDRLGALVDTEGPSAADAGQVGRRGCCGACTQKLSYPSFRNVVRAASGQRAASSPSNT
ncbi:MAG TPA: hypothetical protein PKD61_04000, partial [Polyangiaceae bacterium]|nr:hypothetical protein [Polyangiaceae bacterium]